MHDARSHPLVRCQLPTANNVSPVRLVRKSPMGYEDFDEVTITRQIVIGGKNKYLINGRTVQQSQVTNLFHSVQLNVNNPHFLIMQVRRADLPINR